MKRFNFLALTIFLIAGFFLESNAQRLIIKLHNGDENAELLNSIQKLYFTSDELVVDFITGSDNTYPLADIRKLYFDPTVSVHEISPEPNMLVIYPNPAGNEIAVKNIPVDEGVLRIFSSDGRLVFSGLFSNSSSNYDISALTPGLYLLNVSDFTCKFVKK